MLHEAVVGEEVVDVHGHMNVRYYLEAQYHPDLR
jgi:hypothetical protein